MFKVCTNCENYLSLNKFHCLKKGKFGRHPRCKECRKLVKRNAKHEIVSKICCSNCGLLKNKSKFYKSKSNDTGYQIYCKPCQKEKIIHSMSKINNFVKIILKKFIKKNKKLNIKLTQEDILELYKKQNGRCQITKHKLENKVDLKQRTDNIWNISILIKDETKSLIKREDIYLVCNLISSTKQLYNLNEHDLKEIYEKVSL